MAGLEFANSRPLGPPGQPEVQRDVLDAALAVLESASEPGTFVELPHRWDPAWGKLRTGPRDAPPIVALLRKKPWLFPAFLARRMP